MVHGISTILIPLRQTKNKMQYQYPPGRQVGNRIYYGSHLANEDRHKKCFLIIFTVLFLLIGFIVTIVGHTLKPFWSEESYSFCSQCEKDNRSDRRIAANCRIVGPIFICIGILLLCFTIYYCKKKKSEAISASRGTHGQPAQTTVTYNQGNTSSPQPAYPPTQPPYQAPQPYPSAPKAYPSHSSPQPYASGPQSYSSGPQPYPIGPQPYGTGHQQYEPAQSGPPTQQTYPNENVLPPPPSYDDVVSSEGFDK